MATATYHKAESLTRCIARWSSVSAAIIYGVAFITDSELSWNIVSGNAIYIGLFIAMFAGYALALAGRYETQGSTIALVSLVVAYFAYMMVISSPHPFFLAAGVPALFYLMAIVLRRNLLSRLEMQM